MPIIDLKNKDGFTSAYIVFTPRDEKGKEDYNGDYVYVEELFIHDSIKGIKTLRNLIRMVIDAFPNAKYGYWKRRKYNERIKVCLKTQVNRS